MTSDRAKDRGPVTAHTCTESEHHREEANKLRRLIGALDASNERSIDERGEMHARLTAAHGRISSLEQECERLRGLVDDACNTGDYLLKVCSKASIYEEASSERLDAIRTAATDAEAESLLRCGWSPR